MNRRVTQVPTRVGPIRVTKTRAAHSTGGLPVVFQVKGANRKLSPVDQLPNTTSRLRPVPREPFCASTYASIAATCPGTCIYKGHGCFVEAGFTAQMMRKLNSSAQGMTGLQVTQIEAAAVDLTFHDGVPQDGARGGRDLRLHVGGDVGGGTFGAKLLAASAKRYLQRGGGTVWTYTHKWKAIPREAFGPISVLASVERPAELAGALERGYAPIITVDSFDGPRAFRLGGVKVVPCPAETRGTTCVECRLCLDRDLAGACVGIALALHGPLVETARRRLEAIQHTTRRTRA